MKFSYERIYTERSEKIIGGLTGCYWPLQWPLLPSWKWTLPKLGQKLHLSRFACEVSHLQAQWVPENILSSNAATNTKVINVDSEMHLSQSLLSLLSNFDTFKLQENSQGLEPIFYERWKKPRKKEPSRQLEGASYTCLFTLIHFTLESFTRLTKQLPEKPQEASIIFCNMRFYAIKFKVVTPFPSQMWNSSWSKF